MELFPRVTARTSQLRLLGILNRHDVFSADMQGYRGGKPREDNDLNLLSFLN